MEPTAKEVIEIIMNAEDEKLREIAKNNPNYLRLVIEIFTTKINYLVLIMAYELSNKLEKP